MGGPGDSLVAEQQTLDDESRHGPSFGDDGDNLMKLGQEGSDEP